MGGSAPHKYLLSKTCSITLLVLSLALGASPLSANARIITGPTLWVQSLFFNNFLSGIIITGPTIVAGPTIFASKTTDTTNTTTTPSPHEPSEFSVLTHRKFNERVEEGWSANADEEFSIVEDTSAPVSPPNVGQALFPRGLRGGFEPIATQIDINDHNIRHLYISFWLKLSDNWQSHLIGNKVLYVWIHEKPVVIVAFIPISGRIYPQIRVQDTPDGNEGATNYELNASRIEVERGKWQHWEVLLVANTGSEKNGEIRWWLDGTLVGAHTGVRFGLSDSSWDEIAWRPVWGGSGGVVGEDQYMWIDELYASGR